MGNHPSQRAPVACSRLPTRMVAEYMSFLQATEIARSLAVCKGWKLTTPLEDMLFKKRYMTDFGPTTSALPAIAITGADTPWKTRYSRRARLLRAWESGEDAEYTLDEVFLMALIPGTNWLAVVESRPPNPTGPDGYKYFLRVLELPSMKELQKCSIGSKPHYLTATRSNIFHTSSLQVVHQLSIGQTALESQCSYSPDTRADFRISTVEAEDDILAVGDSDGTVWIWNTAVHNLLHTIAPREKSSTVYQLLLDLPRNLCWIVYYNSGIYNLRLDTGVVQQKKDSRQKFENMHLSRKHKLLLLTTSARPAEIRDAETLVLCGTFTRSKFCNACVNEDHLLVGTDYKRMKLQSWSRPDTVFWEREHPEQVAAIRQLYAQQCDHARILFLCHNGLLRIWDFSPME